MSGRPLVCSDLSHVRTMFPFRDGVNAVFCQPDFSDIATIAAALRSDRASADNSGRDGVDRRGAIGPRRWPDILESGSVAMSGISCRMASDRRGETDASGWLLTTNRRHPVVR